MQRPRQENQEQGLVQLRLMTVDSVTKIHSPRQVRRDAVGVIREPPGEATNPADGDAKSERYRKKIAGTARNRQPLLDPLHGQRTAEQSSHDGLAGQQISWIVPSMPRGHRIFQPIQQLAADRRAADRCRNNPHAAGVGQEIATALPAQAKQLESGQIGQRFKNQMRRYPQTTDRHEDRKRQCGHTASIAGILLDARRQTLFAAALLRVADMKVLGLQDLFFGLQPIVEFRAGRASARDVKFVSPLPDTFFQRKVFGFWFVGRSW